MSQRKRSSEECAVPPLAETQSRLRGAVVAGDVAAVVPLLVGGRDPEKRLAVHARNYETSLVKALLGKFPATHWLLGTPFLMEAARAFIRVRPPGAPCIAEYGADFPVFLAARPLAERVPYLRCFAELEWHLGQVSIAVDRPALSLGDVSVLDGASLADATLAIQPGVRYLEAPWAIDELIELYLTEQAPEQFQLAAAAVWLEIRGARGAFRIKRLDAAELEFRVAIQGGRTVAEAAELAMETDAAFDAGRSFAKLVAEGLVTAIR
jgi:hypothetical protein